MRGQLLCCHSLFGCMNYGQRQAKVSVAGAATLKQHVPTIGGQGWDSAHSLIFTLSHEGHDHKEKTLLDSQDAVGREIRSVGFKEGQREHAHVNGGSLLRVGHGKAWPCGSHFFNCSTPLWGTSLHVNIVVIKQAPLQPRTK